MSTPARRDATPVRRTVSTLVSSPPVTLLLVVLLLVVVADTGVASTVTPRTRNVILTSDWGLPAPDPSGLTYRASTHTIFVVDSEVDETDLYDGANIWEVRRSGRVVRMGSTLEFSHEPADIAYRPHTDHFFIADDDQDTVFDVGIGNDRRLGTSDDHVRAISTAPFGSTDPEGLAFGKGVLYISDGVDKRIYRLRPGPNGRYDGVAPEGDDRVSSFGTADLGLDEPEGVEYQGSSHHLFIVSRFDRVVAETTLSGDLIRTFDIDGQVNEPADVTIAPGTTGGGASLFVADRGYDNDLHPDENDGRIVEFRLTRT
jgi:SdiA-regulated